MAPKRFWRAVRLEHPVVTARLLAYALALLLFTHLFLFAVSTWLVYRDGRIWMGGSRWVPGLTVAEAAMRSLWPYRLGDSWSILTGRWQRWLEFDGTVLTGYPHWFLLAWTGLTPLAFLVLSDTLRRVRVRHVHLVRAAVYSFSAAPLVFALYPVIGLLGERVGASWLAWHGLRGLGDWLQWLVFFAGLAWLLRFWWVVPRDYLRLPHAVGVSIAMLTVGGLGSTVLIVLVALYDVKR